MSAKTDSAITQDETALMGVGVHRLVRLLDSGDLAPHLMIDISGRGLPIADTLEACGIKIVRIRKSGDGWAEVTP